MRVLIITDEEREAAHKVALFAAQPENHYRPGPQAKVPGDDSRHVLNINSFRCVFTYTKSPEHGLFRHLSISIPTPSAYAHPAMVETISHLFGFTGKLEDWQVGPHQRDNCIIVAQML
jgi:hypothetical protein